MSLMLLCPDSGDRQDGTPIENIRGKWHWSGGTWVCCWGGWVHTSDVRVQEDQGEFHTLGNGLQQCLHPWLTWCQVPWVSRLTHWYHAMSISQITCLRQLPWRLTWSQMLIVSLTVTKLKTPVVTCYKVVMLPHITMHFTTPQHYNNFRHCNTSGMLQH